MSFFHPILSSCLKSDKRRTLLQFAHAAPHVRSCALAKSAHTILLRSSRPSSQIPMRCLVLLSRSSTPVLHWPFPACSKNVAIHFCQDRKKKQSTQQKNEMTHWQHEGGQRVNALKQNETSCPQLQLPFAFIPNPTRSPTSSGR